MAETVLVVDDDPHTREVVVFALSKAGYTALEASDGKKGLQAILQHTPDLVVLDIGMPEMDGLDVCREIRKTSDVPIVFLSSRDEEIDRILGLEIGGDDYVSKPFSPRELVTRVKVILRRPRGDTAAAATTAAIEIDEDKKPLSHGRIRLNPAEHVASFGHERIDLTATEFAILYAFLKRPQHVRDRNSIIDAIYAVNAHVSGRTVDSHVRHIRLKFEKAGCENVIETVHGVGYKLGRCL